jgi:hypothetical protein
MGGGVQVVVAIEYLRQMCMLFHKFKTQILQKNWEGGGGGGAHEVVVAVIYAAVGQLSKVNETDCWLWIEEEEGDQHGLGHSSRLQARRYKPEQKRQRFRCYKIQRKRNQNDVSEVRQLEGEVGSHLIFFTVLSDIVAAFGIYDADPC